MKLIDKDALVAKIERLLSIHTKRYNELAKYEVWITAKEIEYIIQGLKEALSIIDTLEVKEVDLNEYINKYFKGWYVDLTDQGNILHTPDGNAGLMSAKEVARHFFELGVNQAQKGK